MDQALSANWMPQSAAAALKIVTSQSRVWAGIFVSVHGVAVEAALFAGLGPVERVNYCRNCRRCQRRWLPKLAGCCSAASTAGMHANRGGVHVAVAAALSNAKWAYHSCCCVPHRSAQQLCCSPL